MATIFKSNLVFGVKLYRIYKESGIFVKILQTIDPDND